MISLLFPSQVVITKTVSITSNKEKVKQKLSNTADWKNWNQFISDGIVEKNAGSNSDTVLFSFKDNSDQLLSSQFNFYGNQPNAVLLNWSLFEKLPWYKPWKKFRAMVLNKEMAAIMDTSLNSFKAQIELTR